MSRETDICEWLVRHPGSSRAEIATAFGLPRTTVTSVVGRLLGQGLVDEAPDPRHAGGRGRPPTVLSRRGADLLVGVVIATPTRARAAVVDYRGQIHSRAHALIDASSERAVVTSLRSCLDTAATKGGIALTGLDELVVGLPAAIRPDTRRPALTPVPENSAGWNGLAPWLSTSVIDHLAAELPREPHVENDANLAALAECEFGAGRQFRNTMYLKLTAAGIGCGLIIDNHLQRGSTGFAGELAHMHIHPDGPICHCGGRGCLATILGQDVFRALEPGADGPDRLRAIDAIAATLGRALSPLCTLLNPDAVILDAGLGQIGPRIRDGIGHSLRAATSPAAVATLHIVTGELDDAEVLGAPALARNASR
ncbi:ROK family transcriptional regulator [Pseudonocardia broussonetiae]|uniref:ROK family transcriptional regulator n=1 Tax=Pseudonocardia broussonetiae TaxID=2736640 RepID=A0A6M6JU77_9PSEU|nr:ROK family transcriptional regulator [Pseudonocardia broussonetiae]QJY49999.1 ROK family transcriptional regulator [Pseudonocardia broussonetiae]